LSKKYDCLYKEVSAKSGNSIDELFTNITEKLLSKEKI